VCVLTADGALFCWGENGQGQLGRAELGALASRPPVVAGRPRFNGSYAPMWVETPARLRAVSAGGEHSCGLTADGRAYCWGANESGQLGNGLEHRRTSRGISWGLSVRTRGLSAVKGDLRYSAVSAGLAHTCAIAIGGKAYCWGANPEGQLGDGSRQDTDVPTAVQGALTFATISAGARHTCGVTTAGTVYCWGGNLKGQLGTGVRDSVRAEPVPVRVAATPEEIASEGRAAERAAAADRARVEGAFVVGRVLTGRATADRSGKAWPFRVRVTSFAASSGAWAGELEWLTLGSVHRVEGTLRGPQVAFQEAAFIKRGSAVLGCVYTLTADAARMQAQGTWGDCAGTPGGGNVWLELR
jgi:hypothetical protein